MEDAHFTAAVHNEVFHSRVTKSVDGFRHLRVHGKGNME